MVASSTNFIAGPGLGIRDWEFEKKTDAVASTRAGSMMRLKGRFEAVSCPRRLRSANTRYPNPARKRKAPLEAGPSPERIAWRSARNDVDRLARFSALDLELDRAVDQ